MGPLKCTYLSTLGLFEQYYEICKYFEFTEGKRRDNSTNEFQKHLQLHDLSVRKYFDDKYALWRDFRTINEMPYTGQVGG